MVTIGDLKKRPDRFPLRSRAVVELFKYPVYLGSIVFSFGNNRLLCETRLCFGICRRHGAQNRSVLDVREDLSTGSTSKLPAEVVFRKKSHGVLICVDK